MEKLEFPRDVSISDRPPFLSYYDRFTTRAYTTSWLKSNMLLKCIKVNSNLFPDDKVETFFIIIYVNSIFCSCGINCRDVDGCLSSSPVFGKEIERSKFEFEILDRLQYVTEYAFKIFLN